MGREEVAGDGWRPQAMAGGGRRQVASPSRGGRRLAADGWRPTTGGIPKPWRAAAGGRRPTTSPSHDGACTGDDTTTVATGSGSDHGSESGWGERK
ncbi:hypothetical protein GUJ93_ZPchr0014g47346 [Zizania palustris]|uniref:Uncharacterized protein n=1 Tax=Zizania palustris TaxID=103762 RepID=A0A8J5TAU7_ZIZPA|nr:hypothetical protein GUJ93_ZPchr0014g47346 [Zizania palustris]